MKSYFLTATLFIGLTPIFSANADVGEAQPNVLMISIDDLNDWVGCLGGHPQAKTPNLDRLARSGTLFTNAHAAGVACNPSRTAVFTGLSPARSGLYGNRQKMRDVLPDAEIMPKTFSRHGYHAAGSGKLLHYFIDAASWNDYFPDARSENPFPPTLYPATRPLSLPRAGEWQYVETDWGPLNVTDEKFGGDFLVAQWIARQLTTPQAKPFFLACGFYRPHEPWFVPQKYFEPFPLESIQIPPGYREDDLNDLPPEGQKLGPNRYFAHIQQQDQWKRAIQGYLASIYFADTMLGHVLDALESGPHARNTIVVLWSDHGWHLGEKQHWQKYTAWRACTRVPLIVRVPSGIKALPQGTTSNTCSQPVNLLSLFPTLLDLCGLPAELSHDGPSLLPLLRDQNSEWPHVSLTHLTTPGSYGLSTKDWRYIRYAGGGEELYEINKDPHEWNNLATVEAHQNQLQKMRSLAPQQFAPMPTPPPEQRANLPWRVATRNDAPPSRPTGKQVTIDITNSSGGPVKLFSLDERTQPKFAAIIYNGKTHRENTQEGIVWQVTDGNGYQRGYFRAGNRDATAIIPPAFRATQSR